MRQGSRCSGYTLHELIITLGILAIVAAVAIPKYQDVKTKAEDAKLDGALAMMRSAILNYSAQEISAGRASRFAAGQDAGWPVLSQVDDAHCSPSLLPKVVPNGDVPVNPKAKYLYPDNPEKWDCVLDKTQEEFECVDNQGGWYYDAGTGKFWEKQSYFSCKGGS